MTATILFVDDDRALRNAGKQTLELAGYHVTPCESGEQALRQITRDCGLLVTDVRMPGMDGFALMEKALKIDPDLPVVMITGHGDVSMAVRAIRQGAYDFIEKPFPSELLVDCAHRAIERRRLVLENRDLRQSLLQDSGETTIIGRTPAIERMRAIISAVAQTDADVLVMGETGTGKEMVARALHHQSDRRAHKFVALNCGAMPEQLFESELFGHEAGAFTGAAKRRVGRMEYADKGTLFLDEIESMPMGLQVKILRALQERAIEPLGSNELISLNLRVVAATKISLKQACAEQKFREDLYYRLNVVMIHIPPLRERRDDIPLLFQHFLLLAANRYGREPPKVTPHLMHRLCAHDWPVNVLELKNAADRFVLGLEDDLEILPIFTLQPAPKSARLSLPDEMDVFEKSLIVTELAKQGGSATATAQSLGIPRKTLYDKLRRHGLSAEEFRG